HLPRPSCLRSETARSKNRIKFAESGRSILKVYTPTLVGWIELLRSTGRCEENTLLTSHGHRTRKFTQPSLHPTSKRWTIVSLDEPDSIKNVRLDYADRRDAQSAGKKRLPEKTW